MDEEKLTKARQRKAQLLEAIEATRQKKQRVIFVSQNLNSEYKSGKITKEQLSWKLQDALNKRTLKQWIKYYDDYISYYKYQIQLCDRLNKEGTKKESRIVRNLLIALIILVLLGIVIALGIILSPVIVDKVSGFSEMISGLSLEKGLIKEGGVEEHLGTEKPVGEIKEAELAMQKPGVFSERPEVIQLANRKSKGEIKAIHLQAVIGEAVKWIAEVKEGENIELELPKDAVNIKLETGEIKEISKKGIFRKRVLVELEKNVKKQK